MVRRKARAPDSYSDAALYLCQNAADLRPELGAERWDSLIRAFLAAEPSTGEWRDAIRALHDAAAAAGIPGGLGLEVIMGPGFPAGPAPRSSGWVCPTRHCPRVELRDDAAALAPAAQTPAAQTPAAPASSAPTPAAPMTAAPMTAAPRCPLSGRPLRLVE